MEEPPKKRARLESEHDPNSLAFRLAQHADATSGKVSAEELVGISGYINSSLPPFENAIIKHRFTDFLVWEIARGGEVVRLHDISRPTTTVPNSDVKDVTQEPPKLEDHMSAEKLAELHAFVEAGQTPGAVFYSDAIETKEARKAYHQAIREAYEGKLNSTAGENGVIKIVWSSGSSKDKRAIRPSKKEQRNLPEYIRFTLQKTNRETQDCISHLGTRLAGHPKDLSTAGTKDRRGVTTQHVTLRRGRKTVEEVWDMVNGLHHGRSRGAFKNGKKGDSDSVADREGMVPKERGDRGMRIGDLKYVDSPLDLGMLDGNRFCIALRELQVPSEDVISSAVKTLENTGFINFYGMQRFGNSSVPTHAIGLALLKSNWAEAANLILRERDGDSDELRFARRAWLDEHDAPKALRNIPRWAVAERCLLEFYEKNGGDSNQHGALSKIPKNLRMMYVHAYQSYIWNSATSARIKLFGCEKPIPGDLVYAEPSEAKEAEAPSEPSLSGRKITKESLKANSKVAKVKVLSEADLGHYTGQDVVLPLPGYNIVYPTGSIGELYRSMLAADGLDADDLFRSTKEYSLGGAYRKIVTKPSDVSWEVLRYSDPDEQLLQPDEDALLGMEAPKLDQEGARMALKIEFGLDTASYATMALREVLKSETGNVQQKELSEKAKGQTQDLQGQDAEGQAANNDVANGQPSGMLLT